MKYKYIYILLYSQGKISLKRKFLIFDQSDRRNLYLKRLIELIFSSISASFSNMKIYVRDSCRNQELGMQLLLISGLIRESFLLATGWFSGKHAN